MNILPREQVRAAISRWQEREAYRNRNLQLIREGRPLEADTPERVEKFLARRGFSPSATAAIVGGGIRKRAFIGEERVDAQPAPDALERMLGSNDLVGRAFLDRCLQVARTVGRIWMGVTSGRPRGYGTGFLISPRLLMTNHHVLGDREMARTSLIEMDYEIGTGGAFPTAAFSIDIDSFFAAEEHLDYAVVGVRPESANGRPLSEFGWNSLIEEEGKAIVAQWVNIVQHPNGEPKQYGLRENQVIDILPEFLHYKTDTAPGSSGSPVFNDRWEVVGLHHSGIWKTNAAGQILAVGGQIWRPEMGDGKIDWIANEGVRISKILAHLRTQPMAPGQRTLFDEIFTAASEISASPRPMPIAPAASASVPPPRTAPPNGTTVNVRVAGDGEIIVSVKADTAARDSSASARASAPAVTDSMPSGPSPKSRDEILAVAQSEFAGRADVLGVRWGYVFKDGWITKDPALVVVVRRKQALSELREAGISPLPDTFGGYPVEVTGPTPEELLDAQGHSAVTEALLAPPPVSPEEITYVPPANAALTKVVNEKMRVIAHVSPDAGWKQLSTFLGGIRKRLVVGMFDFGAPHILKATQTACAKQGFSKFTLVIQPGESIGDGTKVDDLADAEVISQLSKKLKRKFESAWVKIGSVNGWVASSYHIKVAVRDSAAFWLSSGNWQSSNQPNANPVSENPPDAKWLKNYNREWHAVVEHAGLAKTYEAFLQNDFVHNRQNTPHEALAAPDLLLPDLLLPEATERVQEFQYFKPFNKNRKFTVTPILSPDNYFDQVVALIQSASDELLIQNQTFNAPGANQDALRKLMNAVRERQQAGVHVRIIFRYIVPANVRKNLEALQDFGFDMNTIRVQANCHTKGIIVDRKKVLLGSQNISSDGISVNRDASLLFDDAPLAEYFAKIFEHDWKNLTRQDIGHEFGPIELAPADGSIPTGMVRMSWKDYLETL
jgi:V8-like Glu-specific endopeptidase